jgi:hypothetical protein
MPDTGSLGVQGLVRHPSGLTVCFERQACRLYIEVAEEVDGKRLTLAYVGHTNKQAAVQYTTCRPHTRLHRGQHACSAGA